MKILIFTTQFYIPSGAEKLSIQLVKELLRQGHDVELMSMYGDQANEVKDAERELNKLGISNISYLGLPVNPGFKDIFFGIYKLRQLIKQQNYNFIETSLTGPMIIAAWASCLMPVGVIGGIHAVYTKTMHNTKKQRLWRFTTRFIKKLKLYAISSAVADAWSEYASIDRDRIKVIYNSIDDECFTEESIPSTLRKQLDIPQEARIVLFVGNIVMYKGVDTLIDSIGPVLENLNAYVVLVGAKGKAESFFAADECQYVDFYKKINKSSWSNRVIFLGLRNDVNALMSEADLLVHPARTEGFGLVIAEALAAGLPVIASDVGGIPEVLSDSGSFMVKPDDVESLREEIIKYFLLDSDSIQKIILEGKKKALKYRVNNRAKSLITLSGKNKSL